MNTKSYKIMTIIFSILIIAAVVLFYVGVFALPIGSGNDYRIYGYVEQLINYIKALGTGSGAEERITVIAVVVTTGLVVTFTVIFGIVGIVYTIILLVKSIQALTNLKKSRGPLKSLTAYGVAMLVYICLLLSVISAETSERSASIGAGPILILVSALICLVAAGYYHFTDKTDRRVICNVFDLVTSAFAIVGMMLFFSKSLSYSISATYSGKAGFIIGVETIVISAAHAESAPDTPAMVAMLLTLVGIIFSLCSLAFARGVIGNGFCYKLSEKRRIDYPKSSIVKASFWLVFTLAGIILISVSDIPNMDFSASVLMIVGTVFSGVALVFAIINKCFQGRPDKVWPRKEKVNKPKPQYRYYDDDEIIVPIPPKKEEDVFTPIPIEDKPAPAPKKDEDEGLAPIPIEE